MGAIENWQAVDIRDIPVTKSGRGYEIAKRVIDMAVAATALIVLSPLLIPVAIAIKLDSRGPVFYRRRVVGRTGSAFDAYKLRTMLENGDPKLEQNERLLEQFNSKQKLKDDPRITRLGKVLRKTSVDELPQLINVLKGEMSLVGPRMISFPELVRFGEWQDRILEVRPGITGLWQVSGRSDLDYDERVRLNVYYVNNRSLALDLGILARTIPAVISGRGAY